MTTPKTTTTFEPNSTKTQTPPKTAVAAPKATIVETVTPVVAKMPIKKPELIDRVVAETGLKKKDVKPVVEATLAVLGRTLAGGEDITAPPLGKMMIKRVKDVANARVLTLKLRYPSGDDRPKRDPLEDGEQDV